MKNKDYCREISSWIDPLLIRDANIRLIKNRDKALDESSICLTSCVIESSEEACFRELIEKYLNDFYIPKGIIDLANLDKKISEEVEQWLSTLSYKGKIFDAPNDINQLENLNPLLIIEERDLFLDIITQPITMLAFMISKCAETWKEMKQINGINAFLQHSSPGSLLVYIESKVAISYGFEHAADCGFVVADGAGNFGYRYISAIGNIKSLNDELFIKALKKSAVDLAESTKSN